MKSLLDHVSRRGVIKTLAAAAAALPLLRLGKAVAKEEKNRRIRKATVDLGNVWIGHL